jgi:4,5-dihydroxyphthalate decarboxylase
VADAEAACRSWQRRHGAIPLNHVIVVRETLAGDEQTMGELFGLFRSSRDLAGSAVDREATPLGLEANRRNLEVAIDVAAAQGLLARPLTVDDLVTRAVATLH